MHPAPVVRDNLQRGSSLSFKSRLTVYIDNMMGDVVSGSPIRLWMFPAGFGVKRRATHGRNVAHQTAL